jgi:flagellar biosynthesis/type III secretory pathway M-ring protein FliF/YscJ
MKQLNEIQPEALIALGLMSVFTVMLGAVFWCFSNEAEKQSLYQKTYDKSMECRIAYKDREKLNIDNVCGKVPDIKDFVK